ncbi:MAG TPA: DUF5996 family protein [Acidimicrobiia bacterium]|nr:DUF5996 family protein [Acidimicrobiia bacterium]
MQISDLPEQWEETRSSLQKYAQALTAFPRAGAPPEPRWGHVAMIPTPSGFAASPTPLIDGSELTSRLDLDDHLIRVNAGTDELVVPLTEGWAPTRLATAIQRLASQRGTEVAIDDERVSDTEVQPYDRAAGAAFAASAHAAIEAMIRVNTAIRGEIAGPHLWPHGFDIATEWFSPKVVDYEGSDANAQIAMGWYPARSSYLYVNPWPFDETFAAIPLPAGAVWHRDGWHGAKLDIPADGSVSVEDAVALGLAVHAIAGEALQV